ncbi:unnamed protein product [Urochloa humidicola]
MDSHQISEHGGAARARRCSGGGRSSTAKAERRRDCARSIFSLEKRTGLRHRRWRTSGEGCVRFWLQRRCTKLRPGEEPPISSEIGVKSPPYPVK